MSQDNYEMYTSKLQALVALAVEGNLTWADESRRVKELMAIYPKLNERGREKAMKKWDTLCERYPDNGVLMPGAPPGT